MSSNPAFPFSSKGFDIGSRFPIRPNESAKPKPRQSQPPLLAGRSPYDLQPSNIKKDSNNNNPTNASAIFNKFLKTHDDFNAKSQRAGQPSSTNANSLHGYDVNKSTISSHSYQQQHYGSGSYGTGEWGTMSLNAKILQNNGNNSGKPMSMRQNQPQHDNFMGGNRNHPGIGSQKIIKNQSMFEPSRPSRHENHGMMHSGNPSHHSSKLDFHDFNAQSNPTTKKIPRFSEPPMLQNNDDTDTASHSSHGSMYSSPYNSNNNGAMNINNSPPLRTKPSTDSFGTSSIGKEMFKKNKQSNGNANNPINSNNNNGVNNPSLTNSPGTLKFPKHSAFSVNDFAKGKDLGSGKFGSVQIVRHKKTGFVCAMKTVPKSVIREENIINQFIRQLKIQSCMDHPNIVKLYGFFEDKDNVYLLLQLGSEGQLYKKIKAKKRLSEPTAAFVMRQICEAIKYLHSLHIIHRDIKPQNIVISYGTVKLCDFGWAVCKGSELRSTFCGTPLYVSPQILKGQMYDQKIDLWSVGILTYELLVGDIPFEISSQEQLVKIIKEDITFPSDIPISDQAKDFVLKILKKNPDERLKIEKLLQHPFLHKSVDGADILL